MPMQGSLLGTVMAMDAARPYVDGDGTANDLVFAGTIPHSLFVVARSLFFPLSWHHTPGFPVLLHNSVHPITNSELHSPPNRCIQQVP
jgi:hypothetical protein